MTKYLKSRSTHIIVKCILGIIILSLILTTMNSYMNQDSEKYIATVNGEKIHLKIFQNMYFIEREKQKKILGKNFFKFNRNKKFIEKTYNYVLSQLINNILLEQYVKKINLEVSDEIIKETILNAPIFQKNNKFDKEKYFNYLSSINLTNHEYINIIKTKINTENLINIIANSNFILEKEKQNIIKLISQKRVIKKSIVKIDSVIDKQNVTTIEEKKYFNKYKHNFYIPEKFKINFIQLKPDNFKTNCNDKEINEWYKKNIKKYLTKEQRRYSIIQIKNKYEALLILSKLHNKPEEFSKIARTKSTDPISAKNSGDIGWMSVDLIPKEIKNANLNQINQISDIIPFRNEFLIVKLDEIIVEKQKKINEVYHIIEKEINNKKSLDLYHELQNKISNFIKKNPNKFNLFIKENNITVKETNWFDKNSIPKALDIPILKKIIFNKKSLFNNRKLKSHINFIKLNNNESFLINFKGFKSKKMQNFNNVRQHIIKRIKLIKAIKETKKISENIIDELKKGNVDLFKKYNLSFSDSEVVSRYNDDPISSIVFSLPYPLKDKKIYSLYQDKSNNFVIILLEKIYNQNFSEQEKNIIIEYLEKNNTETIFNSILKHLRSNSTIKYEKIEGII